GGCGVPAATLRCRALLSDVQNGCMTPRVPRRRALAAAAAAGFGLPAAAQAAPQPARPRGSVVNLRVATFNASLNRAAEGDLLEDLAADPDSGVCEDPQIRAVAEIIQINNPDIVLLNEFDHDEDGTGIYLLRTK